MENVGISGSFNKNVSIDSVKEANKQYLKNKREKRIRETS